MKVLDRTNFRQSQIDFERGEILNINKPQGWTSFDVVKKVRNLIKVKKVGHAGTLDPFATGVLIVCTGRATKKVSEFMNFEKEYLATLTLGKVTDTYDCTGVVLRKSNPEEFAISELSSLCTEYVGEIYQTPPMYSAVKVNGKRLYKLARQGVVVEREPRKVKIHKIDIVDYDHPLLTLRIVCSKGTYIRSLAYDLGERLGCGAYLSALTRTRIGRYKIENALTIEMLEHLIKEL